MILALLFSVLDLNAATVAELDGLPGIGRKKAEAIVAFRDKHPFRRPTEVMRVKGVGQKLYLRLKESVCAGASCARVEVGAAGHSEQERAEPSH